MRSRRSSRCTWGARLALQFVYFEREVFRAGLGFRLAELGLVSLFAFLALVYGGVAARG